MVGPMPGVSEGPMTTAPAPSPSRNEMRAVGRVDELAELLGADDQHVAGGPGADQRVGLADAVASSRRRRREMSNAAAGVAPIRSAMIAAAAGVWWKLVTVRQDHRVDVGGREAGVLDRLARGAARRGRRHVRAGARRGVRVMMPVR